VIAKRHPLAMPPAAGVAWQASIGTIPVALLSLFEHPVWSGVTPRGWAAALYIGTIPLTVAYLAWFRALRLVPASTAAATVLVSPVMGVLGSAVMLGEALGPRQWVALAVTLSGVALAATAPAQARAASPSPSRGAPPSSPNGASSSPSRRIPPSSVSAASSTPLQGPAGRGASPDGGPN
jgi:drug/metabolite transporter (DMT)-like permease